MKKHSNKAQAEMIKRFKNGESASAIAKSMGLYTTSVSRVLKRNGLKMRECKGKNHPCWKGGRGIKSGYWTVYAPNHPRALNIGRVWEHILVMEKHIGRYIDKSEPIHHINGNRLDNRIENLYLCKDSSEHQNIHAGLDRVLEQLVENSVIKFRNGKYTLN